MSLHLFKEKLERYHNLIERGKHTKAIAEMRQYLTEGLEEESDAHRLMQVAKHFDEGVQQTIIELEQGLPHDALRQLDELKESLKQIKLYADLVSKDEANLE